MKTEDSDVNNAHEHQNEDSKKPTSNNAHSEDDAAGGKSERIHTMSHHSSHKSVAVKSQRQHRTLKDAKKDRQQVEKDAELLANRIALLKQEEMRTWK